MAEPEGVADLVHYQIVILGQAVLVRAGPSRGKGIDRFPCQFRGEHINLQIVLLQWKSLVAQPALGITSRLEGAGTVHVPLPQRNIHRPVHQTVPFSRAQTHSAAGALVVPDLEVEGIPRGAQQPVGEGGGRAGGGEAVGARDAEDGDGVRPLRDISVGA
eukprot:CAMPEP_0194318752 /NCGR_PEP_ID=MMETSP0171-20130528/15310_1 /TAXON_ID=218684 /ORGANISM="Corethron pennatum, Strain L29A3" /LENGTH=159 /DNA_ID=CAMNT_0039075747 /DNA_START=331 /DNA_END=807 /DNA_ORIENTATION=-